MRRRTTTNSKPHRKAGAKSATAKPRQAATKTNAESDEQDEAIKRLVEAGLLRPATKPRRMPPFTRRPIRGPSIVQTIREERDDS